MAGYSATPLQRKLGIREDQRAVFVNAPEIYARTLGPLPGGVRVRRRLAGKVDFIQLFCRRRAELTRRFPTARRALARDGMLWVSWPKKSSPLHADLDENIVRRIGLDNGLVDVKVCAVDEDWSGLKFVYRREDR